MPLRLEQSGGREALASPRTERLPACGGPPVLQGEGPSAGTQSLRGE